MPTIRIFLNRPMRKRFGYGRINRNYDQRFLWLGPVFVHIVFPKPLTD